MKHRKRIAMFLVITLIVGGLGIAPHKGVYAKSKKARLSNRKITISVGKTKLVRLKNVSKKVTWKVISGKKVVKLVKKLGKYKNTVKIKGRKAGKAVLRAKCNRKTYKVRIIVNEKKTKPKEETTPQQIITTAPQEQYAIITFDCRGGTPIKCIKRKIGEPYGKLPIAYHDELVFVGWETESRGIKETDICTGDITLYANFVKMMETQKLAIISFDANGGTEIEDVCVIPIGGPHTFFGPIPIPEREEYRFLGWYTKSEGGEQIFSEKGVIVYDKEPIVDENDDLIECVLYAHYEKIEERERGCTKTP